MQEKSKRLSLGRVLAFASADIFGGGSFNILNFFYPAFLALAVGLPAYHAGVIMMIARFWDAIIDPTIGAISDRLRGRFGTRRGTIILCAPLALVALVLAFFPFSNPSLSFRFWAVLLSYMFFCLVSSMIMIPYYSLSSEMTEDYTDRARMNTVRLGFSIFSSILCVVAPGMIINSNLGFSLFSSVVHFFAPNANIDSYANNFGYIAMGLVFGTVFMICILITGLFAKEGIPAPKHIEKFSPKDFMRPFKVKTFRQYLVLAVCTQVTMAIMSALFFFYIDFYYCRNITAAGGASTNMVGLIGAAIMFGMQIVALPFYMAMIKKTSKTAVYVLGSLIWIISALVILILPANSSPIILYVLAAVLGFGISGPGLIPHAIFGDVVDVGNLQFDSRTAGAFSGIANLFNQGCPAFALAIVMSILGLAGFTEKDIAAGTDILAQPASAQTAIIFIMALAPLVFMSIGIIVCARYKLNKDKHAQVLAALEGGEDEKAAVLESL